MLKIAVVASSYEQAHSFIKYKFKDKIAQHISSRGIFELKNGDILYITYEIMKERELGMVYDAFVVTPQYTTLLDIVRHRAEREI